MLRRHPATPPATKPDKIWSATSELRVAQRRLLEQTEHPVSTDAFARSAALIRQADALYSAYCVQQNKSADAVAAKADALVADLVSGRATAADLASRRQALTDPLAGVTPAWRAVQRACSTISAKAWQAGRAELDAIGADLYAEAARTVTRAEELGEFHTDADKLLARYEALSAVAAIIHRVHADVRIPAPGRVLSAVRRANAERADALKAAEDLATQRRVSAWIDQASPGHNSRGSDVFSA
jgi:alkylhydroperoxidase family enzyme